MRTIVYVDGFNLYYGSLKGTRHKWFDLCAYFRRTLPAGHDLEKVKYFTARVSPLPNDPDAPRRQDVYLRALRAQSKSRIEIIEGHFSVKTVKMPRQSDPHRMVDVIKTEEKGSDVNLAVALVHDAWSENFDCAAVVSNDADLEMALRITKQFRKKRVILYTPGAPVRRPLTRLTRWSNRQIDVLAADVAACQLPDSIPGTNLTKPTRW